MPGAWFTNRWGRVKPGVFMCVPIEVQAQHQLCGIETGYGCIAQFMEIKAILIAVINSFLDETCYIFTDA